MFLGTVHAQMRHDRGTPAVDDAPARQWLSGFGGAGAIDGSGDTHGLSYAMGGLAGGVEHRFNTNLLQVLQSAQSRRLRHERPLWQR